MGVGLEKIFFFFYRIKIHLIKNLTSPADSFSKQFTDKPVVPSESVSAELLCFQFQRGQIQHGLQGAGPSLGLETAPQSRRQNSFPRPKPSSSMSPSPAPQPAPTFPISTLQPPPPCISRGLLPHPALGALFQLRYNYRSRSFSSSLFLFNKTVLCLHRSPFLHSSHLSLPLSPSCRKCLGFSHWGVMVKLLPAD